MKTEKLKKHGTSTSCSNHELNSLSKEQIDLSYHGFRRHLDGQTKRSKITVFVWESDGKQLFPILNFTQFMNRNVKILGRRLYSPIGCCLARRRSFFLIFHTFVCNFFSREPRLPSQIYRQMYGKLENLTGCGPMPHRGQ